MTMFITLPNPDNPGLTWTDYAHIEDGSQVFNYTHKVISVQCDGYELTRALDITGLPRFGIVQIFPRPWAMLILANWNLIK